MAYHTKWDPSRAFECWKKAEADALRYNEAPHGFLYRFTEQHYAAIQPYADPVSGDGEWYSIHQIELEAIPIRSITKAGWTIKADNGLGWRLILQDSVKQFACPTVLEALASYLARKKKQQSIYEARAVAAKRYHDMAIGSSAIQIPRK